MNNFQKFSKYISLHFECTSKVLSESKTLGQATRMCPNIWNTRRIQSECSECTSIIKECTMHFHSDCIPAHSGARVARVTSGTLRSRTPGRGCKAARQERKSNLLPLENWLWTCYTKEAFTEIYTRPRTTTVCSNQGNDLFDFYHLT